MPLHSAWDRVNNRPRNHFLASLPQAEYERVCEKLVPVELTSGMLLSEPNEAVVNLYFPETGLISTNATTSEGESIEVGMVGREGFSGLAGLFGQPEMPHAVVVQNPGYGYRLRTSILQAELQSSEKVRELVNNFTYVQLVTSTQSVLCARLHTLQQRLSRWLLTAADRSESEQLNLTQEYLAGMLGARRSTVTVTAQLLQEMGAIEYRRARITIVDRPTLQDAACECYQIIRASYDRLIPTFDSVKR